jgi:hypothetical protein
MFVNDHSLSQRMDVDDLHARDTRVRPQQVKDVEKIDERRPNPAASIVGP